jgi:hypothetical protein
MFHMYDYVSSLQVFKLILISIAQPSHEKNFINYILLHFPCSYVTSILHVYTSECMFKILNYINFWIPKDT